MLYSVSTSGLQIQKTFVFSCPDKSSAADSLFKLPPFILYVCRHVQCPPLVPYRNYVTHVGRRYKPYLFKNREALNRILRGKCLINQSNLVLRDEEIETLCLGLNYIPS